MMQGRIRQLNEEAVTIEFGDIISESVNRMVTAFQRGLQADPFPGFVEAVPAYCTVTVYYDAVKISRIFPYRQESVFEIVCKYLSPLLTQADNCLSVAPEEMLIPLCYEDACAPDIETVLGFSKLSKEELIVLHSSIVYTVFFIGFIPGFPYLGINPDPLNVPRKKQPSMAVPAGSVALAGRQCGIYPFTIPGGWQVIGQTPVTLFDKNEDPVCLLKAGMQIRFVPISYDEFLKTSGK